MDKNPVTELLVQALATKTYGVQIYENDVKTGIGARAKETR